MLTKLQAGYRHKVRVVTVTALPECSGINKEFIIKQEEKSCKQCQFFRNYECDIVDKTTEGDDYNTIHPDAICNNFTEKDVISDNLKYWMKFL